MAKGHISSRPRILSFQFADFFIVKSLGISSTFATAGKNRLLFKTSHRGKKVSNFLHFDEFVGFFLCCSGVFLDLEPNMFGGRRGKDQM